METTEKRTDNFKDRIIEFIQSEEQRENIFLKS